ncbi:MAG: TonB-dependent receptor plug domain-containing protein [Thermodesulfobacteriota bacterium]
MSKQMRDSIRPVLAIALAAILVSAFSVPPQASAQSGGGSSNVEEVLTLGTRVEGKSISESTVPVEIISEDEIRATGHTEVGRIIQSIVASFNFPSSSISDGTDSLRPATLRGLGPDQVLVLINGSRRHGSALIHINSSVGRGTSGYDMNSIPVAAISRIEVLRDGASAQYGSDAVAGVINIILKNGAEEGRAFTSYGRTYEGDGNSYVASAGKGVSFAEGGSAFFSFEFRNRDRTNRAGLSGAVQYPETEYFVVGKYADDAEDGGDPLTFNNFQPGLGLSVDTATPVANSSDGTNSYDYSGATFNAAKYGLGSDGDTIAEASNAAKTTGINGTVLKDGDVVLSDSADNSNEKVFNRDNFRVGDAESVQYSGAVTVSMPLRDIAGFSMWLTGSLRENTSGGFYRRPNQLDRNPVNSDYPNGFLPLIETSINDWGGKVGLTRELSAGSVDFSISGGWNEFGFKVKNSHNASYVNCTRNFNNTGATDGTETVNQDCLDNNIVYNANGAVPSSADSGTFKLGLVNANLDFKHPFDFGHFAWGLDYRIDFFSVEAGEPYSYLDYDGDGGGSGGIQVFPGFKPGDEVSEQRHAFGFYSDLETKVFQRFTIAPAIRIERYSDFGTTLNGKLSSRTSPLEWLTVRGSMSSGFRAPSMQQLYLNNTSTQFNLVDGVMVPTEVGTFRNDSEIAKQVGIPELEEEKSVSLSGGFILNPFPSLSFSADFYWIRVEDRIVLSDQITKGNTPSIQHLDIGSAQFFMNTADTETRGVDISASWLVAFRNASTLNLTLNGTINETEIKEVTLPAGLAEDLFTARDRSIIESWQPKDRWTLSATYTWRMVTATLTAHRYGEHSETECNRDENTGLCDKTISQKYSAKYVNDAQLGFNFGRYGTLKVGASNIFDIKPDKNVIGQARGGTIVDHEGNVIVDSAGVFTYSRRTAPFGFNGGFYYLSWERKI